MKFVDETEPVEDQWGWKSALDDIEYVSLHADGDSAYVILHEPFTNDPSRFYVDDIPKLIKALTLAQCASYKIANGE